VGIKHLRNLGLKPLLVLAGVFVLAGCISTKSLPPASYREGIVGTWATAGGSYVIRYFADGTACYCRSVGKNIEDPSNRWITRFTWEIHGKTLIRTLVKSDDPFADPGSTRVYNIDFMSKDRLTWYHYVKTGRRTTLTRVPSDIAKDYCEP
jgi:uncharacterized protein (DUF2147 family)